MKPLVTFVLPSFNRASVLREVLLHLRPDRQPLANETLVIDNASSDDSAAMVRREFPWVRLHALDQNLGTESRNIGIREARGKYVMMLDDDSYPLGDSVRQGIDLLEADVRREVGCVAYRVRRVDGSLESAGLFTSYVGCGALFRRESLVAVGGYPEGYLFYVEEYDVSCRLWGAGLSTINPPDLEVLHLKSLLNRNTGVIIRQLVRNNQLMWSRFLPPALAAQQIAFELWRYERIARKEGALAEYQEGRAAGLELSESARMDRSRELSPAAARRTLGLDVLAARVERLAATGCRRVLIWSAGKQLHFLIARLRDAGLEPVGIVDDNPCMHGEELDGVPIASRERFARKDYDVVQIGSSSVTVNDALTRQGASRLDAPVRRLCDYDHAVAALPARAGSLEQTAEHGVGLR